MLLRHMLPAARVELLGPKPQKPSYRLLLQLATAKAQNALNEANNTHRAWAIDDVTLQTVSGQEEYEIGAGIGKVLDVTNIIDQPSDNYNEYQVPFYDLTQLADGWSTWGGWNDWGYVGATRIAFYRRSGLDSLYARIRPVPQSGISYRVSFNIGSWSEGAALDDEPFLTAHHHYLVCDIARDALPAAEWFSDDEAGEKRNQARRQALDTSLSRRVDQYYKQFKLGIAGLTVPRVTERMEAYSIE